jgi:hypothetical protein
VDGRHERLPRREQRPGEVEEVEQVGPARCGHGLLGGNPPRSGVEAPATEPKIPDCDAPRGDGFGAGARREQREP